MKPAIRRISFILLVLIIFSCQKTEVESPAHPEIIHSIEQHRAEKDSIFATTTYSPLLPVDKENFEGLHYFSVDLNLRFEGSIVKYNPQEEDTIIGTKGDRRPALKYGYFPFQYRGKSYRLQIYKILHSNPEYENYLFLGFTDETSGNETYGGGRYIDLTENEDNFYTVDFNLAYNPYCAYNSKYSCAIPSSENRLTFAVTAGEKNFKEH